MLLEDFKNNSNEWVPYTLTNRIATYTKMGRMWYAMKHRCKVEGSHQKQYPSYIGCLMSENFKDFQFFANWYAQQIGYGLEDYEIDKDLLFHGNKLYHENKCIIIPRSLNLFGYVSFKTKGLYPQGVSFHKGTGKFQSQILIDSEKVYLGVFDTPEEAYGAYKAAKEAEARRWYQRLLDKEFIVDPRVIERMRTWALGS